MPLADSLTTLFFPHPRINMVLVTATQTAQALAQSHLCGRTAALVQAQALVGVALLSHELTQPQENITLRLRVCGPLGGVLTEATHDGALRGYTNTKVLNELDGLPKPQVARALGELAEVQVVRSLPGHIIASGMVEIAPPTIANGIQKYYKNSLQRDVAVHIAAQNTGEHLNFAHGILIECLPDGDRTYWQEVCARLTDAAVTAALAGGADPATLSRLLQLEGGQPTPPRALRFACRCNVQRVTQMVESLPLADLTALVAKQTPAQIFCHMCGKEYTISLEKLTELITHQSAT